MREMDYGTGYQYAHDEPDRVAAGMTCLPPSLAGRRYYQPTDQGREKLLAQRVAELDRLRETAFPKREKSAPK